MAETALRPTGTFCRFRRFRTADPLRFSFRCSLVFGDRITVAAPACDSRLGPQAAGRNADSRFDRNSADRFGCSPARCRAKLALCKRFFPWGVSVLAQFAGQRSDSYAQGFGGFRPVAAEPLECGLDQSSFHLL